MAQAKAAQAKIASKPTAKAKTPPASTKLVDKLDDILDEIDEVLEDNAVEVVRAYIQKPGQ